MKIDPLISLAFTLHAHPGAYAVLLGSGVSKAAGIPTGWEITLDLTKRLAALMGEECNPDPESWFQAKFGQEPTYTALLNELAKAPTERNRLLASYIEPTDEDRESGLKVPTLAHRSIAELVRNGHVKVILTTNFDRLMEQALEEAGVRPIVIQSPDAVDGAIPLIHSNCTLLKLHGDYLDTRTKNIETELDAYDHRIDNLLDRIFDEFGLIVCGWSADWDTALRCALERVKGRRFTTFWTVKGKMGDSARSLSELRAAEVLEIESADTFFKAISGKLDALDRLDQSHPVSREIAVVQTKKFLSESRYRIQLHDFLMDEVSLVLDFVLSPDFPITGRISSTELPERTQAFFRRSENLIGIISTGCRWGGRDDTQAWIDALNRLGNPGKPESSWISGLLGLRYLPALLAFYAGGIGCVISKQYETLFRLFEEPIVRDYEKKHSILIGLKRQIEPDIFKTIEGFNNRKLAMSDFLCNRLSGVFDHLVPSENEFQRYFDQFEIICSAWYSDNEEWAKPGAFMYRHDCNPGGSVLSDFKQEFDSRGSEWDLLKVGFFGGDSERFKAAFQRVIQMANRIGW